MTETINEDFELITSNIEILKNEFNIDFVIDISCGYPSLYPEVHQITFRYKPYTFIAVLPRYNDGTPWTDIFDGAIKKIIEKENLVVTKEFEFSGHGDSVSSTTNSYDVSKRRGIENHEVNEVLGVGGFNRTYYVTHNINDIDYKTILEGYDEKIKDEKGNWCNIENLVALNKAVTDYFDPRNIFLNKIEELKKEFIDSIKPIITPYSEKFNFIIDEFLNPKGYKKGDIVETTDGSFYMVIGSSNHSIARRLNFNHDITRNRIEFDEKIDKEDLSYTFLSCQKINQNGTLSIKGGYDTIFYSHICRKVGVIDDFKNPKDMKKLITNKLP